jgi:hypothetical protein
MRPAFLAFVLGTSLLPTACGQKGTTPAGEPDHPTTTQPAPRLPSKIATSLETSPTCDGVRELVVDTVIHQLVAGHAYAYDGYRHPRPVPPRTRAPMADPMPAKTADVDRAGAVADTKLEKQQTAPAGPSHHTTTNVQEKGVDEADIVKSDGKYVYTLRGSELMIAKTWPVTEAEMAARVTFKKLTPQHLYLHGDEVIVQGVAHDGGQPKTRVLVIDASDRELPRLTRTYDIDGTNASSRLIGDDMYLVQNGTLTIPPKLYEVAQKTLAAVPRADGATLRPWEVQGRIADAMRAELMSKITQADIDASLPGIRGAQATKMTCADLYVPASSAQLGMTSVARLALKSGNDAYVGAMVSGGQVYASTESMYVTAPVYTWNQQGHASHSTAVHKFSLTANNGRPTYVASGSVDGQLLNQFSMSEHEGDLRIATTDWNWTDAQNGGNNLFVLRAKGQKLDTIGQIRGLAKGERIYSGRMFGDKGYLVTFRQTDPLFTLDLSNPENPRVVGELKINGFSSYIHPMGGGLLLTIGQDATDTGRITGLHLQVFDVTNPAKPTRRFHEKLAAGTSSTAMANHHAFTYDPVTGTLAIPLQDYTDGQPFTGLAVYKLDPRTGFTSLGRIDHRAVATKMRNEKCGTQDKDPWAGDAHGICDRNQWGYMMHHHAQIDRSIVVDNFLLGVGVSGLSIHKLGRLIEVASVTWTSNGDHDTVTLAER